MQKGQFFASPADRFGRTVDNFPTRPTALLRWHQADMVMDTPIGVLLTCDAC